MLDTNTLNQIAQAAPAAQEAFNAWHVVALGAGAWLAHAYHSVKDAGGIKNIFLGLWDGGSASSAAAGPVESTNNSQATTITKQETNQTR